MGYLEDSLAEGERVVAKFHQHWTVWIAPFFMTIVILLIPFALIAAIRIRTQEHGVTTKRIVFKRGFIARETEEMKLSSVETVEISQTVWGRILGFGEVQITGRGTSDLVMKRIADPLGVKKTIESVRSTEP